MIPLTGQVVQIKETYVNDTEHYQFGDSGWFEPITDDLGKLYKDLRSEYGGTVYRMYKEIPVNDGDHLPSPAIPIKERREYKDAHVGWVFSKRMKYEDSRPNNPNSYYTRSVWVEVRTKQS